MGTAPRNPTHDTNSRDLRVLLLPKGSRQRKTLRGRPTTIMNTPMSNATDVYKRQPLSRIHHEGNVAVEPWLFGEEAEKNAKAAIELKYRLLPYIYTYCLLYTSRCV